MHFSVCCLNTFLTLKIKIICCCWHERIQEAQLPQRDRALLRVIEYGSFKVVDSGGVQQSMYDFLLVSHSNDSCVLYHFRIL